MKLWLFLFYFISSALFALPSPYDALEEVKPFLDHGWYANARQLHALIREHNVKTILEVGSWLGCSTIDLAKTIPEDGKVYAVDHWLGSIENQPGQEAWHPVLPYLYEQFLSNIIHAGLTDKVIPIRMDSLKAARVFDKQVDLIYIDATHSTAAVYQDLCAWYPFVEKKGILCGDDWGWETVRAGVILFAEERNLNIHAEENFWRLERKGCEKRKRFENR